MQNTVNSGSINSNKLNSCSRFPVSAYILAITVQEVNIYLITGNLATNSVSHPSSPVWRKQETSV